VVGANVPFPETDLSGLRRQPEPLFVLPQRFIGALAVDAEGKLAAGGNGKSHLAGLEDMRRVIIGHELADQLAVRDQGNKRYRADAFGKDGLAERVRKLGLADVCDEDRLRIAYVGSPGRMTFHGGASSVARAREQPRSASRRHYRTAESTRAGTATLPKSRRALHRKFQEENARAAAGR
jgi:hypothetical protein